MDSRRITSIELFALETQPVLTGISGRTAARLLVLRLSIDEHVSYGECVISLNGRSLDLIKWGSYLRSIRNCTLEEALTKAQLQHKGWTTHQVQLLQAALAGLVRSVHPPLKIASGSAKIEYQGYMSVSQRSSVSYSLYQRTGGWKVSRLFEEAVSYYSILA